MMIGVVLPIKALRIFCGRFNSNAMVAEVSYQSRIKRLFPIKVSPHLLFGFPLCLLPKGGSGGWLPNPAPVDGKHPIILGFQHVSTIFLVVQEFFHGTLP